MFFQDFCTFITHKWPLAFFVTQLWKQGHFRVASLDFFFFFLINKYSLYNMAVTLILKVW